MLPNKCDENSTQKQENSDYKGFLKENDNNLGKKIFLLQYSEQNINFFTYENISSDFYIQYPDISFNKKISNVIY